ncbi:hypothetical protein TNIN_343431 [Trichonephila inaurata madagascariensis]|uniref:Uncharacterized protein n=1 Tax=Trichonephila inaurata madagascariensis TaxID=2747483 RepID=A0A8X6IHE1_9ARAC|nr:hypothetical protein TNIN_343431 [Trichonephila inaurata madagascariensis]
MKEQTTSGEQSRVRHKRKYSMTSYGFSIDYYWTDHGIHRGGGEAGRKVEECQEKSCNSSEPEEGHYHLCCSLVGSQREKLRKEKSVEVVITMFTAVW